MAVRKPLVLVNGEIQQLQSGDTISAPSSEVDVVVLTNGDGGSHLLGDVVYISDDDEAKKAKADAGATANAIALAITTIGTGASGTYQTDGIITGLSGLTAGAAYYLDETTAGAMTDTAPSSTGEYVVRLGIAISATEFDIKIERAILL